MYNNIGDLFLKKLTDLLNLFSQKQNSVSTPIDDVPQFASNDGLDPSDFVNFGDIARSRLNMQSQYASYYVDGRFDKKQNLGKGLHFIGDTRNYHELLIYKNDVDEFVRRATDRKITGQIA